MFERFQAHFQMRKVKRMMENHPIYYAALKIIRTTLSNENEGLGKYADEETKAAISAQIIESVSKIIAAPNSIMANREQLSGAALIFAKYEVIIMDETDENRTGLRGKPGITGQLKPRLGDLALIDEELRELTFEINSDPHSTDFFDACVFRYWRACLDMNVYNAIRIVLGDCHADTDKDWFRSFLASLCASQESEYRKQLGMPDVLAEQDEYGDIAALKHSTYLNIVMSGVRFPNLEFEEHYKKVR